MLLTTALRSALFIGSLAAISACRPGLPDLDDLNAWSGTHVTYHASPSLQPCGGTPGYVDAFAPFVAGELGISAPTGLRYLWLTPEDLAETECDYACQFSKYAIAPAPMILHEVVHAVTRSAGMNRWPFFSEGIAVAYDFWSGDGMGHRYLLPVEAGDPLPDPRPMMIESSDGVHYGIAGAFVAFLLARHGPERFVNFTRQLRSPRNLDRLRARFRDTYARELDDEVELFMHGASCDDHAFPVLPYDCTMPDVPWKTPDVWSFTSVMDCADEHVVGGVSPDETWHSIRSVTLDLPVSGRYLLSAVGDIDVQVQLGACFGCPWEERWALIKTGEAIEIPLDAGPYYLRIRALSNETPQVDVHLFAPDGPL